MGDVASLVMCVSLFEGVACSDVVLLLSVAECLKRHCPLSWASCVSLSSGVAAVFGVAWGFSGDIVGGV